MRPFASLLTHSSELFRKFAKKLQDSRYTLLYIDQTNLRLSFEKNKLPTFFFQVTGQINSEDRCRISIKLDDLEKKLGRDAIYARFSVPSLIIHNYRSHLKISENVSITFSMNSFCEVLFWSKNSEELVNLLIKYFQFFEQIIDKFLTLKELNELNCPILPTDLKLD